MRKLYCFIAVILALMLSAVGCGVTEERSQDTTQSADAFDMVRVNLEIASTVGYGNVWNKIQSYKEDPKMASDIILDIEDVATPERTVLAVKKLFEACYGEDPDYAEYVDYTIVISQDWENHVWYAYSCSLGAFGGGYACLIDYQTGEVIAVWPQK